PQYFVSVDLEDRASACGEPEAGTAGGLRPDQRFRARRDACRAKPEARKIETRGAEPQPNGIGRTGRPCVGALIAIGLGKIGPAWIFMGDEVLFPREEEERVHL